MQMWAANFPDRQSSHNVFPFEKYGAMGREEIFGFVAGAVAYDTDPSRPIGDWKEAWEKAKERAGAILAGRSNEPQLKKGGRPKAKRQSLESRPVVKMRMQITPSSAGSTICATVPSHGCSKRAFLTR
jgi:hypothetical protein